VVVRAQDRTGADRVIEGTGLLARALQHELDHLDGVLFLDRLRGIKRDLIVRKVRKLRRAGQW
jgi:peptide deformylase